MPSTRGISRRALLGGAASLVFAGGARAAAEDRYKLREFTYADVSLTGGPLARQVERLRLHYLGLDEDRILKVYRQRAGLRAPGADMGGWYDANGFVPGHLIGQFISGLSRLAANHGDQACAAKAERLIHGYAATLGPTDNPFASPIASTTWPCYILDKYEIGLLDAASLTGNEEARKLLPRVISGALPFIPDHTYDRTPDSPKQAPYDEPYILSENLFRSFELTGDRQYFDMAKKYLLNTEFFDPLSEGRNILPGKHGYSHVIALSSGAKAYEMLGDEKYLRALRNAWDMLEQTQQYASGAWAAKEAFVRPHLGELADTLTATREHFETPCGYYAHSKLARYLLGFTGEARYADGLERVLLNTILGALDPRGDGEYFYYSDYHARAKKGFYKKKWPCCAGTLLQSVADYPLNLYFHAPGELYVSFFAASEVRWKTGGVPVTVSQRTEFPESEAVEVRVAPERPVEFTLRLRIPAWCRSPRLLLNGKPVAIEAGTFAAIHRTWRRSDKVELSLPFAVRAVPVDDLNPQTAAVMHGPLMLSVMEPAAELAVSLDALMAMRRAESGLQCEGQSGPLRFKPFYQVQSELYSTYLQTK